MPSFVPLVYQAVSFYSKTSIFERNDKPQSSSELLLPQFLVSSSLFRNSSLGPFIFSNEKMVVRVSKNNNSNDAFKIFQLLVMSAKSTSNSFDDVDDPQTIFEAIASATHSATKEQRKSCIEKMFRKEGCFILDPITHAASTTLQFCPRFVVKNGYPSKSYCGTSHGKDEDISLPIFFKLLKTEYFSRSLKYLEVRKCPGILCSLVFPMLTAIETIKLDITGAVENGADYDFEFPATLKEFHLHTHLLREQELSGLASFFESNGASKNNLRKFSLRCNMATTRSAYFDYEYFRNEFCPTVRNCTKKLTHLCLQFGLENGQEIFLEGISTWNLPNVEKLELMATFGSGRQLTAAICSACSPTKLKSLTIQCSSALQFGDALLKQITSKFLLLEELEFRANYFEVHSGNFLLLDPSDQKEDVDGEHDLLPLQQLHSLKFNKCILSPQLLRLHNLPNLTSLHIKRASWLENPCTMLSDLIDHYRNHNQAPGGSRIVYKGLTEIDFSYSFHEKIKDILDVLLSSALLRQTLRRLIFPRSNQVGLLAPHDVAKFTNLELLEFRGARQVTNFHLESFERQLIDERGKIFLRDDDKCEEEFKNFVNRTKIVFSQEQPFCDDGADADDSSQDLGGEDVVESDSDDTTDSLEAGVCHADSDEEWDSDQD